MKKLLVLMLVLGMASLANATLVAGNVTWNVVGSQLIGTGTALGDGDWSIGLGSALAMAGILDEDGTTDGVLSDGVMFIAGDRGKVIDNTWYYSMFAGDLVAPNTQSLGDWFRFDIGATDTAEIYSADFSTYYGSVPIPEPITMILLGLGGLFIRRKK